MMGPALLDLQARSHTTIAQFSISVTLQVRDHSVIIPGAGIYGIYAKKD